MLKVEVLNGNIEQALKKYKSKVIKTKQLKEVRNNRYYTKPTSENRLNKQKADRVNQWNKKNNNQA
jgi:small subunit ribosomal protein S21